MWEREQGWGFRLPMALFKSIMARSGSKIILARGQHSLSSFPWHQQIEGRGISSMTHKRILIVDDDPALLQALPEALQLRMDDLEVDTADSAAAALEQIAQIDYDAIITDIKMPGMDGLELLNKVKELRPETPTLLITGHGEHDLAVQALRGGAYDFIQKPIDRDYFVASLSRAVQTHQLRLRVAEQQRALEQHARSLEVAVQERTRELVEANAAKDEFLSMASH